MDLTTEQAASLAGVTPGVFRANASRQRTVFGYEMHAPRSEWPNKRTPMWDEDKVKEWAASRALGAATPARRKKASDQ
jgi:hypothetical protein